MIHWLMGMEFGRFCDFYQIGTNLSRRHKMINNIAFEGAFSAINRQNVGLWVDKMFH